jgi:hypothetical protein
MRDDHTADKVFDERPNASDELRRSGRAPPIRGSLLSSSKVRFGHWRSALDAAEAAQDSQRYLASNRSSFTRMCRLETLLIYLAALGASTLTACSIMRESGARATTNTTQEPAVDEPIEVVATSKDAARAAEATRARAQAATVAPPPATLEAAMPPPPSKKAVVVGSSSVQSTFGRVIAADLEQRGYQVTRRGIVSAGLARPDFCDLREVVDSMPIDQDTAAVFVYVGVNDGQAIWLRPSERQRDEGRWLPWRDLRWAEVYERRARNLFRSICERGARQAVVMLPVEVNKASLEHKLRRIRRLQREAALDTSCAMAVSTAGENGLFVRDGRRLRLLDGFHMSPHGARLVWNRVRRRVLQLADLPGFSPPGSP